MRAALTTFSRHVEAPSGRQVSLSVTPLAAYKTILGTNENKRQIAIVFARVREGHGVKPDLRDTKLIKTQLSLAQFHTIYTATAILQRGIPPRYLHCKPSSLHHCCQARRGLVASSAQFRLQTEARDRTVATTSQCFRRPKRLEGEIGPC